MRDVEIQREKLLDEMETRENELIIKVSRQPVWSWQHVVLCICVGERREEGEEGRVRGKGENIGGGRVDHQKMKETMKYK